MLAKVRNLKIHKLPMLNIFWTKQLLKSGGVFWSIICTSKSLSLVLGNVLFSSRVDVMDLCVAKHETTEMETEN